MGRVLGGRQARQHSVSEAAEIAKSHLLTRQQLSRQPCPRFIKQWGVKPRDDQKELATGYEVPALIAYRGSCNELAKESIQERLM